MVVSIVLSAGAMPPLVGLLRVFVGDLEMIGALLPLLKALVTRGGPGCEPAARAAFEA
jgi:hypothetical protein